MLTLKLESQFLRDAYAEVSQGFLRMRILKFKTEEPLLRKQALLPHVPHPLWGSLYLLVRDGC